MDKVKTIESSIIKGLIILFAVVMVGNVKVTIHDYYEYKTQQKIQVNIDKQLNLVKNSVKLKKHNTLCQTLLGEER